MTRLCMWMNISPDFNPGTDLAQTRHAEGADQLLSCTLTLWPQLGKEIGEDNDNDDDESNPYESSSPRN